MNSEDIQANENQISEPQKEFSDSIIDSSDQKSADVDIDFKTIGTFEEINCQKQSSKSQVVLSNQNSDIVLSETGFKSTEISSSDQSPRNPSQSDTSGENFGEELKQSEILQVKESLENVPSVPYQMQPIILQAFEYRLRLDPSSINSKNFPDATSHIKFLQECQQSSNRKLLGYKRYLSVESCLTILKKTYSYWIKEKQPILEPLAQNQFGAIQQFSKQNPAYMEKAPMLPRFYWSNFDVQNENQIFECCEFLEMCLVINGKDYFSLACPPEKFLWSLRTPNYVKEWHISIKDEYGQIIGLIAAAPKNYKIRPNDEGPHQKMKAATVVFMAVHPNHRKIGIAALLMDELKRQVILKNFQQVLFATVHDIPTPFCQTFYMNRVINAKKLYETGFCLEGQKVKKDKLNVSSEKHIIIKGNVRRMVLKDLGAVMKLYNEKHSKFKLFQKMDNDELAHFFQPIDPKQENDFDNPRMVWTWVIENEIINQRTKKSSFSITDFFSMNKLIQLCSESSKKELNHNHQKVQTACLCYYALCENTFNDVIKKCLYLAKTEMNCDAMALMHIMDMDEEVLERHHFERGDGMLNWYLINWSFGPELFKPEQLGTF